MHTNVLTNRHSRGSELGGWLFGSEKTVGRTGIIPEDRIYLSFTASTNDGSTRTSSYQDSEWIDITPRTTPNRFFSGTGDWGLPKTPGSGSVFDVSDDQLALLETASATADETEFVRAYQTVNWTVEPAQNYVRGVQMALAAGAHYVARKLANEGAERFPQHRELQRIAAILAPPVVRPSSRPADPGLNANRDWLKSHRTAYIGRWVALRDGQLLGAAAAAQELRAQIGEIKNRGILITQVY